MSIKLDQTKNTALSRIPECFKEDVETIRAKRIEFQLARERAEVVEREREYHNRASQRPRELLSDIAQSWVPDNVLSLKVEKSKHTGAPSSDTIDRYFTIGQPVPPAIDQSLHIRMRREYRIRPRIHRIAILVGPISVHSAELYWRLTSEDDIEREYPFASYKKPFDSPDNISTDQVVGFRMPNEELVDKWEAMSQVETGSSDHVLLETVLSEALKQLR